MSKIPDTTQAMWDMAYSDFEHAEILLKATIDAPDASPDIIKRREHAARTRKSICNAINFLITNREDINSFIESRKRRGK